MPETELKTIIAKTSGERLDTYLSRQLPELSRSRIQNMIRDGLITVDSRLVKTGFSLQGEESIDVRIVSEVPIAAQPEEIPLNIIYEDKDIIVVNKPQGLVVHPAPGHADGTLVNALLHHCTDLAGVGGALRPGIVHRIDMNTSGLLVAAKNDAAYRGLSKQWQAHDITRIYHAILYGTIQEERGSIDAPIGRHPRERKKMAVEPRHGRDAITHYLVLERLPFVNCTYTELKLETGRTHQIRVHMAQLGHPVVGDDTYGRRKGKYKLNGQALHAKILGFCHPISGEKLFFDSKLPGCFSQLLDEMRTPQ